MKKFKKQTLVVISGLTMLMSAGTALSSTSAVATIDWNSFTITGYGLGSNDAPSYTLSDGDKDASAKASRDWNSIAYNDYFSYSSRADISGTGPGWGSAIATRNKTIDNIVGNGFLVLSANYYIHTEISLPNNNTADASVNFVLSNSINSFTTSSQDSISLGMFGNSIPTSLYKNKSGILSLALMVTAGEVLNLSSTVFANAQDSNSIPATLKAVPVPAALWLFSSALVGLVGLGRPRKAAMG